MKRTTQLARTGFSLESKQKSAQKASLRSRKGIKGSKGVSGIKRSQKPRRAPRRKPTEWDAVRAKLKPLFEHLGVVFCEFAKWDHECWRTHGLSFAHSRKRRDPLFEMYEVALACPPAHQILDEGMSHEEMYVTVMDVIKQRGLIIP